MSDNVAVTAGTGTTLAADEVVDSTLGTVKVQYVKLMDGTLDSTTKISPATSGNQTTANTSLSSIDTKLPAQGQALAAASVPVVLPATQITTLTPPAAITGFATAAKQPALGTAGSASADVLTVQGKASMTPLLTDGSATTQPVTGTFWQATQPVSGTVTASNTAGDVAAGATDNGNPVKVGAKYNLTTPTYSDGQRTDLQADARGNLRVVPSNGSNPASFGADNADAVAVSSTNDKQRVINRNSVYNGTSWDRMPGDTTGIKVQTHAVTNAGTFAVQDTAHARSTLGTQHTTITSSTSETTIATAGGAGVFIDPYRITVTNTSATGTKVTIKDATSGTTRYVWYIAGFDTKGFSSPVGAATPQAASNNNWTLTCTTSVADIEVTVDYAKN